jgi:NAD(P)-dependent dehydrogenase (short-subunit alcohol dehydrogenase family)
VDDLCDRDALVTGCGRDLDRAIAEELQRRGTNVVGIDPATPEPSLRTPAVIERASSLAVNDSDVSSSLDDTLDEKRAPF